LNLKSHSSVIYQGDFVYTICLTVMTQNPGLGLWKLEEPREG